MGQAGVALDADEADHLGAAQSAAGAFPVLLPAEDPFAEQALRLDAAGARMNGFGTAHLGRGQPADGIARGRLDDQPQGSVLPGGIEEHDRLG
jgi:hypothetical protein